ncbi:glycosylphosphatidylinositol anchor biosynthesis [Mortierella sp. GBA35]|nr:glycosylphosphatidylinositol anchor biosynthesis [Mortierella sp. AD031]KAF9101388.1 glycosylphosphatidylinositol anchor biosynthesis [Mortierella sp. GBA35]KAG0210798.1 glycosylphosphatidylinositol anchor biosynthesis [Mortierella sp. NVP41]
MLPSSSGPGTSPSSSSSSPPTATILIRKCSDSRIITSLILFRLINATLVKTFFSPDEYWQALEVGHNITFGYGYLTWEWLVGLRSVLHPALFVALYKVFALLGLDDGSLFIYAPRLLQALFAALGDFYTYRFADRLFENQVTANWTLFLTVASWWNFFCSTRTLANSMEAALTIIALYYWPFINSTSGKYRGNLKLSLFIASLTCIFRPTAAILWLFLGIWLIIGLAMKGRWASIIFTGLNVAVIGGGAILMSAALDKYLLYNEWVWTPLNFLRVNVFEGISLFYGSNPWHWYLSQGLPILFGIYLPLVLIGSYHAFEASTGLNASLKRQVLYLSLWVVLVYSALQHKEWRFLYPILYPLLPFAGETMQRLFLSRTDWRTSKSRIGIVAALVVVNGVMAWYLAMVHQRGVVDVMDWIRETSRKAGQGQELSFGFIMPCHSTPWYSSVHLRDAEPLSMWFITCNPPLGNVDPAAYKDESDIFYEDPIAFMDTRSKDQSPSSQETHLVLFEDLVRTTPEMLTWLESHGYHECARFFNSHFHDDSRRRGDVLVYCTL